MYYGYNEDDELFAPLDDEDEADDRDDASSSQFLVVLYVCHNYNNV